MAPVRIQRVAWPAAGIVAGVASVAVSHAVTMGLTLRPNPFVSVGEFAAGHLPGWVEDTVVKLMGNRDTGEADISGSQVLEPWLVILGLLGFLVVAAVAGELARKGWSRPLPLQFAVGTLGVLLMVGRYTASMITVIPVVLGVVTWIVVLSFVTGPLQRRGAPPHDPDAPLGSRWRRRDFVARSAVMGVGGLTLWLYGGRFGQKRRKVDETRRLLNLPIKRQEPRAAYRVGVEGVRPWRTPTEEFFVKHTALVPPAVELADWRLRVHGMVETELELTYQELVERKFVQRWMTLVSVTNPVGGGEVGNAWWSGVPVAQLLEEAGVQPGADAVLQTSVDGWTCLTPLAALTADRDALVAVGMNGDALTIEHGYPARVIVPGLYGHVSACKWVTSLEVTRFEDADGYATGHGFDELGPAKIASRIDVPSSGAEVAAGPVDIAGTAWALDRGVGSVQVAVDGGPWLTARLAEVPNDDTWVQWAITVELGTGSHRARVRAIAVDGEEQTGVVSDVRPDGATGWHEVEFEVR